MSQQVPVRGSAPSQRGAPIVPIVIAILLIGGAVYGGLYWYSNRDAGKDVPGVTKTAADAVNSFIADLEESLKNIEKEPAKADEEIVKIQTLADDDVADLQKQVAAAPADVKAKVGPMVAASLPKLQTAIDAAYKVPGVQAKLEPLVTKVMTGLKALGV